MKQWMQMILIMGFAFGLLGCGSSGASPGGNDSSGEQGVAGDEPTGPDTAKYRVVFTSLWNTGDHIGVPGNAHFSPIVLTVHNSNHRLFPIGKKVSPGFERLAELGATNQIEPEILAEINAKNVAVSYVRSNQFISSQVSQNFEITVSKDHPAVSFASMIAPSPDWVVGIDGLQLHAVGSGFVADSGEISLFAYNAGTEEGDFGGNFSINNSPTNPEQNMSKLSGPGFLAPVAKVQFIKIEDE